MKKIYQENYFSRRNWIMENMAVNATRKMSRPILVLLNFHPKVSVRAEMVWSPGSIHAFPTTSSDIPAAVKMTARKHRKSLEANPLATMGLHSHMATSMKKLNRNMAGICIRRTPACIRMKCCWH